MLPWLLMGCLLAVASVSDASNASTVVEMAGNKSAFSSSQFGQYKADKALDGDQDSCSRTGGKEAKGRTWLTVDLASNAHIKSIKFLGYAYFNDTLLEKNVKLKVLLLDSFDADSGPQDDKSGVECGSWPVDKLSPSAEETKLFERVATCISNTTHRYVALVTSPDVSLLTCKFEIYGIPGAPINSALSPIQELLSNPLTWVGVGVVAFAILTAFICLTNGSKKEEVVVEQAIPEVVEVVVVKEEGEVPEAVPEPVPGTEAPEAPVVEEAPPAPVEEAPKPEGPKKKNKKVN